MNAVLSNAPSWLILLSPYVIVIGLVLGPTVWRMSRPTPMNDLLAITRFLANRDQKPLKVRRLWIAPWRMRGRLIAEAGRPYRLLATAADGVRYTHLVVADALDAIGNVELKQRQHGVWVPVLQ